MPEVYWDLRRVAGRNVGQHRRPAADAEQRVRIFQIDNLAHCAEAVGGGSSDFRHGVAAVALHREQGRSARLLQDVAQLGGLVGRVGCHQNQAGKAAGEFHQHPFRHIRRPNDDTFARRITRGQRRRQPLAAGQQFGEGPTALGRGRRRIDFDQRYGVAALPRRGAQNAADCRLQDDVVGLGRNIGFGEVETVHGESFRRLGSLGFFSCQFIRIRRVRPVLRLSGRRWSAGSARHRSRQ